MFWRNIVPFKQIKIYHSRSFQLEIPPIYSYTNNELVCYADNEQVWRSSSNFNDDSALQTYDDLPLASEIEEFSMLKKVYVEFLPESYVPRFVLYLFEPVIFFTDTDFTIECPEWNERMELTWTETIIFSSTLINNGDFILHNEFLLQDEQVHHKVSENLLKPIKPPSKIIGRNYASRYWQVSSLLRERYRKRISPKNTGNLPVYQEHIEQKQSINTKKEPIIWDLIFVLLQPPLSFGKTDNLLLPHELYPYQVKGVEFLINNEQALLADDMGTGKTVMTLVALKILMQQNKVKTALIVCPVSVIHEWKKHLDEWTPELITTFVRGKKQIRELEWEYPAHVFVTAYQTLRNDIRSGRLSLDKNQFFDVIVIDEAHHIKNPSTAQSRAIRKFSPKYRWGLTGTPVQNSIDDLRAIFEFIYPGLLTSFDSEVRIKEKIRPHFLRRRKQEVMPELPPKIRQELWLEMNEEQKQAYYEVENDIVNEIEALGDKVTKQHIFAKIQKLKQICNFAPNQVHSPKLEKLLEQVEEIIESGNKVIVFSQYDTEGVSKLEKALLPYGTAKIIGGQTDLVRRIEIDKFKYQDKFPIMIASVRSGGEGLNLAEASYVIHFDHWWNPAVMWQAEDRVHRHGQKNSINVYSYWMLESIDERIYKILERKGLLFENIVDSLADKDIEQLFSIDDLLEMIGVKHNEAVRKKIEWKNWQSMSMDEIRAKLYEIKPFEFEELARNILHYLGYPNVVVTKRTGDGGVDIISTRNTGNGVERIAAQCKRYHGTVGVRVAREFLGAIKDDPSIVKGFLITTGDFTSECIDYCYRNRIEIIPGIKVAEYVKKFSLMEQIERDQTRDELPGIPTKPEKDQSKKETLDTPEEKLRRWQERMYNK